MNSKLICTIMMIAVLSGASCTIAVAADEGSFVKKEAETGRTTYLTRGSKQRRCDERAEERRERRISRWMDPRRRAGRWMRMTVEKRFDFAKRYLRSSLANLALCMSLAVLAWFVLDPIAGSALAIAKVSDESSRGHWTFYRKIGEAAKSYNPQSAREFEKLGHAHSITGDPIQNSMDAKDKDGHPDTPVRVEFSIFDEEMSVSRETAEEFLGANMRRHLRRGRIPQGDEISINSRKAAFDEDVTFLMIEDFGTKGLVGKTDQFEMPTDEMDSKEKEELENNNFRWYNRTQNATSSSLDRRGSWGEGSYTLEYASRSGIQISYSVRKGAEGTDNDPFEVLMGQTTLRNHKLMSVRKKNGVVISTPGTPDEFDQKYEIYDAFGTYSTTDPESARRGDFGTEKSPGSGYFSIDPYTPMPLTERESWQSESINRFREIFKVSRDGEPGLSVMIAHPRKELLDPKIIARSVISRWIIAIHDGLLEVNINLNGSLAYSLTSDTIREIIPALEWNLEEKNVGSMSKPNPANRPKEFWLKILDMLDWNEGPDEEGCFEARRVGKKSAPTWVSPWADYDNPDEKKQEFRDRFESGEVVRVTARPYVRNSKGEAEEGKFEVMMVKTEGELGGQLFAREHMVIPFAGPKKASMGILAIVHCWDGQVEEGTNFMQRILRDSEGPAHLEWQDNAHRILPGTERWSVGPSVIRYANDAVNKLAEELKVTEEGETSHLDMFTYRIRGYDTEVLAKGPGSGKQAPGISTTPPVPKLPPTPSFCRIPSKSSHGSISVRNVKDVDISGFVVSIDSAYKTDRGNAWSRHTKFDFKEGDITYNCSGAQFVGEETKPEKKKGHVMKFRILDPEWKIELLGFGVNRDVAVNASLLEVE